MALIPFRLFPPAGALFPLFLAERFVLADATDATDADTAADVASAPTVGDQPDAEDGWQQRGLCVIDCAVCLCQNERSEKSSDRELRCLRQRQFQGRGGVTGRQNIPDGTTRLGWRGGYAWARFGCLPC